MAADVVVYGALAVMLVVLFAILGAVHNRERFGFVAGLVLFVAAHAAGAGNPAFPGTILAVIALAIAVAATVPLLRQSV